MDLIADRGRRVPVEELNTSRLLAHARKQAVKRKLDDMLIVDVDAHHYENENFREFLPYMENDVLRQLSLASLGKGGRGGVMMSNVGYQDMGGRVTRYPMRASEKTEETGHHPQTNGQQECQALRLGLECHEASARFVGATWGPRKPSTTTATATSNITTWTERRKWR